MNADGSGLKKLSNLRREDSWMNIRLLHQRNDRLRSAAILSFGGDGVGIDALWNPVFRPIATSDFNYYLGFGPSLYFGDPFGLGVVAEAGIEYAFSGIPIVIGADWRPNLRLVEDTDFLVDQFGLNVRWRFGKSRSNTPTTQAPN